MALQLKLQQQPDYSGESVWVINKTGVYNNATNPGGNGTPNVDRNTYALLAYAYLLPSDNIPVPMALTTMGPVSYAPDLANDYQDEWEFNMPTGKEGRVFAYLMQLPLTSDGLSDGKYYYDTVNSEVKKADSVNGDSVVTDYAEMIAEGNVNKPVYAYCESLMMPNIIIATGKLYREYKNMRNQADPEWQEKFNDAMEAMIDNMGTHADWQSGLVVSAQQNVEVLYDRLIK